MDCPLLFLTFTTDNNIMYNTGYGWLRGRGGGGSDDCQESELRGSVWEGEAKNWTNGYLVYGQSNRSYLFDIEKHFKTFFLLHHYTKKKYKIWI